MPYLLLHTETPEAITTEALIAAAVTAKVALTSEQAAAIVAALPPTSPAQVVTMSGTKPQVQQRLAGAADAEPSRWEIVEYTRRANPVAASAAPEFTVG
jgi:hypothetical protein